MMWTATRGHAGPPQKLLRLALLTLLSISAACARHTGEKYFSDPDPLVQAKLDQWQDLKLGLLMHWGTYSQWGIVESWSLCSEDEGWCRSPQRDSIGDYATYKTAYEKLQTTFNPVKFDPVRWARAAKDAGMRYVVFTTKHHDGFSMFDTKQTDYRITSPNTPFSKDPRADVTRGIFDAFRAQGFMIGADFSKPDWHSPDYWWPYFATPDRNPNYDIKKYPERWARFVAFTHAQVNELMSNYGRVDILWLDGGWVQTMSGSAIHAVINAPDYKFKHVQSQDIDMPRLVAEARAKQPGLIVVDRSVPGPYQNYLTPEAHVPDRPLPYPWEVPMPMAQSWSFVPNDHYKSARTLVQMLVDVVAKGGNLLLNIGPGPDGSWADAAYDRLAALGAWMKVNSESIYGTRPLAPFVAGKWRFAQSKDGTEYATYLPDSSEATLPGQLVIPFAQPSRTAVISLLGTELRPIAWQASGAGIALTIPRAVALPNGSAWVFRISLAGAARPGER
jgi:alpha-L-fucosidase